MTDDSPGVANYTTAATGWTAPPRRDWKRIAIIVVVLLVAINLAAIGIRSTVTNSGEGGEALPESILSTNPPCGTLVLAQSEIGAQIATGYRGELALDGVPLPADEYDKLQLADNTLSWKPGPGQTFRQISPGNHFMVISYTPTLQSSRLPAGTYACQFKVS